MARLVQTILVLAAALSVAASANAQDETTSMTPAEMRDQASVMIDQMNAAFARVDAEREDAEGSEADVQKLRCLTDVANDMGGYLEVGENAASELAGTSDADLDSMAHYFGLVETAAANIRRYESEAAQCSGEALVYTGDTQRETNIDSRIADGDQTEVSDQGYVSEEIDLVDVQPEASPFI